MATCKKCGAPIIWRQSPEGKWMPLDEGLIPYKANANGKDTLFDITGDPIRCDIVERQPGAIPTGLARKSHFATCPFANDFRKERTK